MEALTALDPVPLSVVHWTVTGSWPQPPAQPRFDVSFREWSLRPDSCLTRHQAWPVLHRDPRPGGAQIRRYAVPLGGVLSQRRRCSRSCLTPRGYIGSNSTSGMIARKARSILGARGADGGRNSIATAALSSLLDHRPIPQSAARHYAWPTTVFSLLLATSHFPFSTSPTSPTPHSNSPKLTASGCGTLAQGDARMGVANLRSATPSLARGGWSR